MDENTALRKLLWLQHGCSVMALYGDDGEMQCCGTDKHCIDFKRHSPEDIEYQLMSEEGRQMSKALEDYAQRLKEV